MKTLPLALTAVAALTWISACSPKNDRATASVAQPLSSSASAAGSALQPSASHAPAAGTAEPTTAQGPVVETMDAASYTYVRVKTATGDIWAATSTFKVNVGDVVIVPLENPMENFHSQTLKRDFPVIYFTSRIARPGESMGAAASMSGSSDAPASLIAPIPGAPGGVSIASIVTGRKSLSGKAVTIRGQVVKYNGGILGMNWLHVQDGSGATADGTHDILVTTNAVAKVGDIVTVNGTVVLDKDFGAGYSYAVLLQNATVTVK